MGNSNRILKNSIILYVRMALSMLVGLYTSRVILDVLGVVDFGIYNVVGGVTTMFMFLNSSMAVSTSRFLTFELGKNNAPQLSLVYHQAVIIHVIIAIFIFILIETIGQWMLYNQLVIPLDRLNAASWVLHSVSVVVVLNVMSTPDMSLIIAHEKMSSFAYISLLEVFLKLFIAIVLSFWGGDKLILYAILLMCVQLGVRIAYFIYSKKNFIETRGRYMFSKDKFKEMLSFASWNLLGNVALISIDQGINILLNIFNGPVVNASRGISNQMSNVVNTFINNIRIAINPQITKSYSQGDINYMHLLIKYSSLSCFYLILIIGIPLFIFADYLLSLWLVEVPTYTAVFFRFTILNIMVVSFANPIIIGVHATGNIVKFQIVEGILMLLTLPLAWFFLKLGYKPYFVYIAQIIIAIIAQIGRLYVVLPVIDMKVSYYIKEVLYPCLLVFIFAVCGTAIIYNFLTVYDGFVKNVCLAFLPMLLTIIVILFFGLNSQEKYLIRDYISRLIKK